MTRVAIAGANGRTGRCVLECAAADDRFEVVAALVDSGDAHLGQPITVGDHQLTLVDSLDEPCDVLIDFTLPAGTMCWLARCVRLGIPLVTGTTGLATDQLARIDEASKRIAIVRASNFSVGIHLLLGSVGRIARVLGPDFDIEIVETHHRHKRDAPSGTAFSILDAICAKTGRNAETAAVIGRHKETGARPPGTIGIHAIRMGEIVGEHEVHFASGGETLTIRHTAHARTAFATGALRAAAWIIHQEPGLHALADVFDAPRP